MTLTNKELYNLLVSEGYFIKYEGNKVFFGAKHLLTLNKVNLKPVDNKEELAKDLLKWSKLKVVPKLRR